MESKRLTRHILTLKFKGYVSYITDYQNKDQRGMNWWHDRIDWIGGYPFEVSKSEEIFDFYHKRGFQLLGLKTCGGGLGCNEYVFKKLFVGFERFNRRAFRCQSAALPTRLIVYR
jgi:hypothetical protein